jgi:hypothetical protein
VTVVVDIDVEPAENLKVRRMNPTRKKVQQTSSLLPMRGSMVQHPAGVEEMTESVQVGGRT